MGFQCDVCLSSLCNDSDTFWIDAQWISEVRSLLYEELRKLRFREWLVVYTNTLLLSQEVLAQLVPGTGVGHN
jgi:hypothetical protein